MPPTIATWRSEVERGAIVPPLSGGLGEVDVRQPSFFPRRVVVSAVARAMDSDTTWGVFIRRRGLTPCPIGAPSLSRRRQLSSDQRLRSWRSDSNRRPAVYKTAPNASSTSGHWRSRRSGRSQESQECHVASLRAGSRTASGLPPGPRGLDRRLGAP